METYCIETRDGIVLKRNLTSTREAIRYCIEHRIRIDSVYIKKEHEQC